MSDNETNAQPCSQSASSTGSAAPRRCQAVVWKRDCLRYTGRGPGGFSMHYTEKQCGRTATHGEWCHQHHNRNALRCRWAEATMPPNGGSELRREARKSNNEGA